MREKRLRDTWGYSFIGHLKRQKNVTPWGAGGVGNETIVDAPEAKVAHGESGREAKTTSNF